MSHYITVACDTSILNRIGSEVYNKLSKLDLVSTTDMILKNYAWREYGDWIRDNTEDGDFDNYYHSVIMDFEDEINVAMLFKLTHGGVHEEVTEL
jgi:hypothetical protein